MNKQTTGSSSHCQVAVLLSKNIASHKGILSLLLWNDDLFVLLCEIDSLRSTWRMIQFGDLSSWIHKLLGLKLIWYFSSADFEKQWRGLSYVRRTQRWNGFPPSRVENVVGLHWHFWFVRRSWKLRIQSHTCRHCGFAFWSLIQIKHVSTNLTFSEMIWGGNTRRHPCIDMLHGGAGEEPAPPTTLFGGKPWYIFRSPAGTKPANDIVSHVLFKETIGPLSLEFPPDRTLEPKHRPMMIGQPKYQWGRSSACCKGPCLTAHQQEIVSTCEAHWGEMEHTSDGIIPRLHADCPQQRTPPQRPQRRQHSHVLTYY